MIPAELLSYFYPNEIQLLVSGGTNDIDFGDLRNHTQMHGWTDSDAEYVEYFWAFLTSLSSAQKAKFLQFCTGTTKPPLLGFRYLQPNFGVAKVQVSPGEKRWCSASTCANLFRLPYYGSSENGLKMLEQAIIDAVTTDVGFYAE